MRMSAAKKPRTFFLSEAALFFEKSVDKIIYKAMFKIYSISRLLRRLAVRDAYGLEKIHGVLFGGCDDGGKYCPGDEPFILSGGLEEPYSQEMLV